MKRREFLKKSFTATVASGSILSATGAANNSSAAEKIESGYDLVAVKGGGPDIMFEKGISYLGGIGAFVKPGQTVVVKPNIGWDSRPERAANTNPILVGKIVELCVKAGAKKVTVFDHTCDEWTRCYKNSGIEKAVKDAGGEMVQGNEKSNYKAVTIAKGKALKSTEVHSLILNADVFINVPVLKSHGGTKMSNTLKNLMGIVWDRRIWHRTNLHQCIADFSSQIKPDLNIVDGYNVLKRNGPRGVSVNDVANMKYLLISKDMVALDTASAKILEMSLSEVKHIPLAEELGVGTTKLDTLKIKRISI